MRVRGASALALLASESLHEAVMRGDHFEATHLLQMGVCPNILGNLPLSQSPLATACESKQVSMVNLLLDHGADASLPTGSALTPPLGYACRVNSVRCADVLLQRGAFVDAPDGRGMTPLMKCLAHGSWECAWLLLEHGASARGVDLTGRTVLHHAKPNTPIELLDALIAAGADVFAEDADLALALHPYLETQRCKAVLDLVLMEASEPTRRRRRL